MKELPTDRHITYRQQYQKCGKSNCSKCNSKYARGHGPYFYAFWTIGAGKQRRLQSRYIGKELPPDLTPREKGPRRCSKCGIEASAQVPFRVQARVCMKCYSEYQRQYYKQKKYR